MTEPLVRAQGLGMDFSSVTVLDDVSLEIFPGEILGLIGENGAGKSTLMKFLAGIHQPTRGTLHFAGQPVVLRDPKDAKDRGISLVPQEFNLVDHLNVAENVFLGDELRKNGLLDRKAMVARTRDLLDGLGVSMDPEAGIPTLSVAQKQMVEIAKAIKVDARLLIMDEPTTVLAGSEIDVLFRIMGELKARGTAMVYISHKLREIKAVCDRVMVLRDGRFVGLEPVSAWSPQEMARRMVGRELNQMFPAKTDTKGEEVLVLDKVRVPGVLAEVSLTLHRGEILGLAGLMGAGRTEVAETILGLHTPVSGRLVIEGKEGAPSSPRAAVEAGISYLSEDRQGSGILTTFPVTQNVTLVSLRQYARPFIDARLELKKTEEYIGTFGIKAPSPLAYLEHLSGGNQQKVSLAKSLDTGPRILIVDEPTRGIDVMAKGDLYTFLRSLADQGMAILLISSELEELIGLCTRVVVMRDRRVAGELTGDQVNEEDIILLATGVHGDPGSGVKINHASGVPGAS